MILIRSGGHLQQREAAYLYEDAHVSTEKVEMLCYKSYMIPFFSVTESQQCELSKRKCTCLIKHIRPLLQCVDTFQLALFTGFCAMTSCMYSQRVEIQTICGTEVEMTVLCCKLCRMKQKMVGNKSSEKMMDPGH